MPEAAEVAVAASQLGALASGTVLRSLRVTHPRTTRAQPGEALSVFAGGHVETVRRHGKWVVVEFSDRTPWLGIHLRMSGQLLAKRPDDVPADRHVHAVLEFDRPAADVVWFRDPRTFGELRLLDRLVPVAADLHDASVTAAGLQTHAARRRVGVKAVLLDQTAVVSGIGSYLADEALHHARISPVRPADSLAVSAWERILDAAREIATASAEVGGVTLPDEGWVDLYGRPGRYAPALRVHGRSHCGTCGTPTRRGVVGGRSARWCPRCQDARRRR